MCMLVLTVKYAPQALFRIQQGLPVGQVVYSVGLAIFKMQQGHRGVSSVQEPHTQIFQVQALAFNAH